MFSRRHFMKTALASAVGVFSLGGYAVALEPRYRLEVTRWDMTLPRWPADAPPLTAAVLSDLHAVEPWMPARRIAEIVEHTNAIGADIVFLLGDYMSGLAGARRLMPEQWAPALGGLKAPLGVHAILGNHDYHWRGGPEPVANALKAAGIGVLRNQSRRIRGHGHDFWLAGTESSLATPLHRGGGWGRDDLGAALAGIHDDRPIVLLAHEPAQHDDVPERVALTLSGHTHGGQVSLPFLGALGMRGRYGERRVRGPYEEGGRPIVVTSGLGLSLLPVRFMVPPEIMVVRMQGAPIA